MNRDAAIKKLKANESAIRALGATSLYLFGSTARDQAGGRSDLDIFIEYDPAGSFSLLDLVGIKQELEERLGTEVDVSTRDSLHPRLRKRIEETAIRVF